MVDFNIINTASTNAIPSQKRVTSFRQNPTNSLQKDSFDSQLSRWADNICQSATQQKDFQSVIVSISTPNGHTCRASGYKNSPSEKIDTQTICPVGSLSKTYTATLLMRLEMLSNHSASELQQQGIELSEADKQLMQHLKKFSVNDKITQHLPHEISSRIPNAENITIAELLSHTSGVPQYVSPQAVLVNKNYDKLYDFIKNKPFKEAGKEFEYCNTNYVVLGSIIKELTGKSLSEAYREHLFKPLGLDKTYLGIPPKDVENVSRKFSRFDFPIFRIGTPDGSVMASADDLNKFFNSIFRERKYLTQETLDEMCKATPQSIEKGQPYGFAIAQKDGTYWHNGKIIEPITRKDEQAFCVYIPQKNAIVSVLARKKFKWSTVADMKQHIDKIVFDNIQDLP